MTQQEIKKLRSIRLSSEKLQYAKEEVRQRIIEVVRGKICFRRESGICGG